MADILLAKATSVGEVERYVVLKRVLPERSRDPTFARMFLDEARLASQLHHPNIAQVYDIGKLAGSYFFTMEYVHGEDVRSLLNRLAGLERQLPVNNALYIAAGALAALHHAHDRVGADGTSLGIVHRDVSPSNVMVSYEGVIKLLDFGVAKAAQRSAETKSGTIKGKISYLSPEQCKGMVVDRRSDLFSLGVVLYEMLTSRRLFKRDTDFGTMMAIVNDDIPPPSAIRNDVTPELDKVVMTALRKDPERRYATAGEMLEAIEGLAGSEHLVMSATSTGRFLRELFGERPEPWMEIKVRGDEPKAITITSESIHDSDMLSDVSFVGTGRFADEPEDDLEVETQIHETPALWRADHGETSPAVNAVPILPKQADERKRPITGKTIPARPRAPTDDHDLELDTDEAPPVRLVAPMDTQPEHNFASITATTVTPMPSEPSTDRDAPAPRMPAPTPPPPAPVAPPAMVPAPVYPVAASYPSATGLTSFTKLVPDLRPASSRAIVIVVAAVVTLGLVLLVVKLVSSDDSQPEPAAAAVVEDARVVAVDPPPPPPSPPPRDAGARVATPPVTPTPPPPPPVVRHEPTVTELVEAKEYAAALRACAAHKSKPAERTSCGIAACNLGQRAAALQYNKPASVAIERACKAKNIALAPPPAPPVAPHPPPPTPHPPPPTPHPPPPTPPPVAPHPPPPHPPDCEADPLKCQK